MHLGLPSCQTFTAPTPLNPTSICHLIYSFSGQDRAVVVNYADGSLLCVGFNGIFRRYTGYTEHTRTIPKIHGQYRTHTNYTENKRAIPNTHELYRKYTGNTEHTRTIPNSCCPLLYTVDLETVKYSLSPPLS